MSVKALLKKALSTAHEMPVSKLKTSFNPSAFLQHKQFSPVAYNALPDLTAVKQLFEQRQGDAVIRDHLVPLLKQHGFRECLAPVLVYKELSLEPDERIVMNEENQKSAWKMREFLGRRDRTIPRAVCFSDAAFSILEYKVLPEPMASEGRMELTQYTEVSAKTYQLLRMYDLDGVIGLQQTDDCNNAPKEYETASCSTRRFRHLCRPLADNIA